MAKIITLPNQILRQVSKEVEINDETLKIAKELVETLKNTEGVKGVGLSAVQIGIPLRIFIAYSQSSRKILTFINPEIIWYSKRLVDGPNKDNNLEGCLSVPNVWSIIKRPNSIKIRYQTLSGQIQIRKFEKFMAKIIQHEYDHLNGVLFIDHALKQKSKIFEIVKNENNKDFLREIKI